MLPNTIKLQTTFGDVEIPIRSLGAAELPEHDGGAYAHNLHRGFDGYTRESVKEHVKKWTPGKNVRDLAARVEEALEEGIPDQRRRMLRNQDFGMLDDRWISDIAQGDEVEKPFARWSKAKSAECRVAICIDTASTCYTARERDAARNTVAAGLAMALEGLDYEVSIIAACVRSSVDGDKLPRERYATDRYVQTIRVKDESEPYVGSSFAHFAETGVRRLVSCWMSQGNGWSGSLTDREWREMTGADLFVFIGDHGSTINTKGVPGDATIGMKGDDTLSLTVNEPRDIESAISQVEEFFQAMAE